MYVMALAKEMEILKGNVRFSHLKCCAYVLPYKRILYLSVYVRGKRIKWHMLHHHHNALEGTYVTLTLTRYRAACVALNCCLPFALLLLLLPSP